jgi:hypothetical protein
MGTMFSVLRHSLARARKEVGSERSNAAESTEKLFITEALRTRPSTKLRMRGYDEFRPW